VTGVSTGCDILSTRSGLIRSGPGVIRAYPGDQMTEILTESFCERCGTRYTFESARPRKRLKGVKVLSRGLKNFVMSDGTSMDEAMAAARSETDREATAYQLDAFHQTFNFCMSCRQYTCPNCWNEAEARCLTCAPNLGQEIMPAPFPDIAMSADQGSSMVADGADVPGVDGSNGVHDVGEIDAVSRLAALTGPVEAETPTATPTSSGMADSAEAPVGPTEPEWDLSEELEAYERQLEAAAGATAEAPERDAVVAPPELPPEPEPEVVVAEPEAVDVAPAPESEAPQVAAAAVVPVAPEVAASEPAVAPEVPAVPDQPEPAPEAADVAAAPEPTMAPEIAAAAVVPAVPDQPEQAPAADVVAQPVWHMVAPDTTPDVRPAPAQPAAPPAATPPAPPAAASANVNAEPQWPTRPAWQGGAQAGGIPFLNRPAAPQGGMEALWAASARDVKHADASRAGGVQPCVSCGLSLSATARFCRRCGTPQAG
jgi:hypothetical protein